MLLQHFAAFDWSALWKSNKKIHDIKESFLSEHHGDKGNGSEYIRPTIGLDFIQLTTEFFLIFFIQGVNFSKNKTDYFGYRILNSVAQRSRKTPVAVRLLFHSIIWIFDSISLDSQWISESRGDPSALVGRINKANLRNDKTVAS